MPLTSNLPAENGSKQGDALAEESVSENDFAVDEPLPPFDEGFDGIPELSASGEFQGVAPVQAVGGVQLYRLPDGSHLLRLEALRVTGARGALQLRLVKSAESADGLPLGALKGSSGNQNYLIESRHKLSGLTTLAITAQEPAAVIAHAALKPAR